MFFEMCTIIIVSVGLLRFVTIIHLHIINAQIDSSQMLQMCLARELGCSAQFLYKYHTSEHKHRYNRNHVLGLLQQTRCVCTWCGCGSFVECADPLGSGPPTHPHAPLGAQNNKKELCM